MTIYKGDVPIAGLAKNTIVTGFNILDVKWSDHIINDISWLRADTFSWQSGDVYTTVYNKLVEEWNEVASLEDYAENEDGVWFRRTASGYKIVPIRSNNDNEALVLDKYNRTGIAWYYILDIENRRFKLPRTKFGFEGLRDTVGNDIGESLPNIKGSFNIVGSLGDSDWSINTKTHTGAFYPIIVKSGLQTYAQALSNTTDHTSKVGLDASRSSSTYQDNAPVQERATQMYLYFYVGEFAQTAIEQTAGLNAELFNGKLDKQSPTVNSGMTIESGQLKIGNTSSSLGSIELYGGNTTYGGFIDFHYGNSTADYTSRIIETSSGKISINGSNGVYLKYSYNSGIAGYNIWTNGYCEQWSYASATTVGLFKTYRDTEYTVYLTKWTTNASDNAVANVTGKSTSSFSCASGWNSGSGSFYGFWKTCGYLASGQY